MAALMLPLSYSCEFVVVVAAATLGVGASTSCVRHAFDSAFVQRVSGGLS